MDGLTAMSEKPITIITLFCHRGSKTQRKPRNYRSSYDRKEASWNWHPMKHGGKERKYKPDMNHYGSRYAPYDQHKWQSWRIKDKSENQGNLRVKHRES